MISVKLKYPFSIVGVPESAPSSTLEEASSNSAKVALSTLISSKTTQPVALSSLEPRARVKSIFELYKSEPFT